MSLTKHGVLNIAIEITKEAAKGGTERPLETVLVNVYEVLKKLNEEAN